MTDTNDYTLTDDIEIVPEDAGAGYEPTGGYDVPSDDVVDGDDHNREDL